MNKNNIFKAALQSDGALELLVYGTIGFSGDEDAVSAIEMKKAIDEAGNYNKISMRINSPGGDAAEGIAIGNMLKAQKKPIDVHVDGIAASAASIIAMCGDSITMAPNAMLMIHNAWTGCVGYASDLRKMADTLDKVSASIAQTYVDKTGKSMASVKQMMDDETWMSAQDALSDGFCTAIAKNDDDGEAMAYAKTSIASAKVAQGFKNIPTKFKAAAASVDRLTESFQKIVQACQKWEISTSEAIELMNAASKGNTATHNDDMEDKLCACDCVNCLNKDCSNCSMQDCKDENCDDCPNQTEGSQETQTEPTASLDVYEASLNLMRMRVNSL